ncbi:sensor domain-containing diguanylate cyclase [Halanaerobium sp. ST460_2HS_T2]|uniref:sensor domain-containing diguanylate cyclase n=1 Tax=Halanaerobium sp. ST460_2HS_T2 TaxID=2183914 RepID=UPI000DF3B6E0|nr:sensor domain-containing diguanylate cyclase [Halanaerobium sp. ST460_2HS_T2]RCW62373.1 PAS domain S-box-containing protein/diguanylate cyclase (GGDEF)-like protein [Halanaerobium sp. ST460_2HS_T2]
MSKRAVDNLIEKKVNENIVNNLEQKICYYKDPYTYKMANLSYAKFLGKDPGDVENIFCQAKDITNHNILENELRRNRDSLKRIIVSVRDISERKENSLKLKKLSREYETILSNVENAIFLINVESGKFRYQRLNSFHEKATGLKTKEVAGKTPIEIFGEKVGPELEKKYRRCLDKKSSISYEEELTLPAGKRVWLTKLTPVINKGEVEKIVGSSLDITENKKKEREIKYLSLHDEMTELYNRRYFENEMERLDSSRKLPVAILIADLDNLKYVNDNFGHQQGDNYIITAAQMIKESIRGIDIAARIGGDEFALILPETDSDEAEKICNRIKEKESDYLKQKNLIEIFSISIGYAVKKSEEISLEEVFRKADKRMYANKAKNKSKKK